MTTENATVQLTPAMLAAAFWDLSSDEQVEFFRALGDVIKADMDGGNPYAYAHGELQWFYVGEEIHKGVNKQARDVLMSMAAPVYLNVLRHSGGH